MDISKFFKECAIICGYSFGIALLGYLGYHTIRWIIDKCCKTEKVDVVARKALVFENMVSPSKKIIVSRKKARTLKRQMIQSSSQRVEKIASQKLQGEELDKQKAISALKIQALFRGHKARLAVKKEKRHFLSYPLFERAKLFIDQPKRLERLPRAAAGRTPIHLLKEFSVVIKESGFPENNERFSRMKEARIICEESGYSHLDIAQARVYKGRILESEFPIKPHDTKRQIGFYLEHLEELTEAIGEFTGFLCQADLVDITGCTNDAYSTLSEVPIGRYDNVVMFLKKGIGYLALVDLEKKSKFKGQSACGACLDAIRLFPHHLKTIISAAEKFDPTIENRRRELEQERQAVLQYFDIAYLGHLDFVKEKNIDLKNPLKFGSLSSLRKKEIEHSIVDILEKEDQGGRFRRCLRFDSEVALNLFREEAFPEILEATLKFIQKFLKINRDYVVGKAPVLSYSDLLSIRTLKFGNDPLSHALHQTIASKLSMFNIGNGKTLFASLISKAIFRELAKGKEIDYYSENFYAKTASILAGRKTPRMTSCIFC